MKKKSVIAGLGVLAIAMLTTLSSAYAHGYGHGGGGGFYGGCRGGFGGIFFMKAHSIIENKEALGLSEEKVEAIKALKLETKKAFIKQNAELEIVKLDLKSQMHATPFNVEAVNKLLDQKYDLEKAQAKSTVEAIAKLKSNLSKDQEAKLRDLWKKNWKKERSETN